MSRPLSRLLACLSLLGLATGASAAAPDLYRLHPQDLVRITVYDNPDLTTSQRVDVQGRVQISLLGRVALAGLTVGEAEEQLETLFREERYLRDPQVTVAVEDYAPKQISIFGEVRNPGQVDFPIESNRLSIVEVLARAGGFTGLADTDAVKVTRIADDGRQQILRVDVARYLKAREDFTDEPGYLVYPGDVIVVPQRLF